MPSSSSSPPLPEAPSAEPLGLKHPLLPIRALGQNWLSPKFLTPLGANSLTVLDPTLFSPQAASGAGSLSPEFADSPFLTNVRSNQFEPRVTSVAPQRLDSVGRSSSPLPAVQPRLEPFPVQAAADDLEGAASGENRSAAESQPSEGSDAAIGGESASIPTIARPETVQSAPSRIQPAPEAWGEPVSPQQQQSRTSPNSGLPAASKPTPEVASLIPPTIQTQRETVAASPEPAATDRVPGQLELIPESSDSVSAQSSAPPALQTRSEPAIDSAHQALPERNSSFVPPTFPIADSTAATQSSDSVLPDRRDPGAAQPHHSAATFPVAEELNPTVDRPDSLDRAVPTVQARLESSPAPKQKPALPADASELREQSQSDWRASASRPIFPLPASPTPETAWSAIQPEPGSATAADTPAASNSPPVIQTRLEPTFPDQTAQGSGHGPAIAPPFASSIPEFASSPPVIQARSEHSVPDPSVPLSQPDSQSGTSPSLPTVQPQLEPAMKSQAGTTEPEATTAEALNSAPAAAQSLPAVPSIQRQQSTTEPSATEPSTVSIDHPLDTAAEPAIDEPSNSIAPAFEQVSVTHSQNHPGEQSQPSELESVGNQNELVSSPISPPLPQSTAAVAPTVQARFHPRPEPSVESNSIPQPEIIPSSVAALSTSTSPTPSVTQLPTTPHYSEATPQASEVASTVQSQSTPQISLRQADHSTISDTQHSIPSPSTEFTTNADVTESDADSEPAIIPPLPTVLTNLSTLKPLGGVKPLARSTDFLTVPDSADQGSEAPAPPDPTETAPVVQAKADAMPAAPVNANHPGQNPTVDAVPPIDLHDSPTALISSSPSRTPTSSVDRSSPSAVTPESSVPDAWSSIDELLSQSAAPPSAPIVQRFVDDGSLDQLIHQPHPSDLARPLFNDALATPLNAESPVAHTNASVGERPDSPGSDRASTPADQTSADHAAAGNESDDLESLAREIYGLLRQRLEIERERQGTDYSGRLPW